MEINAVFAKILELGMALGWEDISHKAGCQEAKIDEHWWFALNPHDDACACSMGAQVPSMSAYVQFNGFPAGIIGFTGGMIAAGAIANEETLMAALNIAITAAAHA